MKKFFIIVALFAYVFANAASAQDIDVTFTIDWDDNLNAYDVGANCMLFDGAECVVSRPLTANAGYDIYTTTFDDPASRCDSYKIVWNTGEDIDWNPEPCTGGDIWNGIEAETEATPDP